MQQEFFTARELAEIATERAVATFPLSERGVQLLARRDGWNDLPPSLVRRRSGREGGGGTEYHLSILPDVMQGAIAAHRTRAQLADDQAKKSVEAQRQLASLRAASRPAQAQMVAKARAEVLGSIDGFAISTGQSRARAIASLVEAQGLALARQELPRRLARGEILTGAEAAVLAQPCVLTSPSGFDLPLERIAAANDRKGGKISRATLYAWFKARDGAGFGALSPIPPRETLPIPPAFMEFMRFYAQPSKPTITAAFRDYLRAVEAREGIQYLPITLSQARNILRIRLSNIEKHIGREGILTLKARMAYIQRSTADLLPTTIYTADGKTFDAEIADPVSGRAMKPEITSIVDVATRKCVGYAVSRKEDVIAVTEALRRACLSDGIPAIFYTDRGPGYKNKAFDGDNGVELGGLMGRLSIAKMHALPYNSQAKGIVERFNAVWNDLARTLPTYLGRDMDKEAKQKVHKATRRDIREFGTSQILPKWDAFIALCDATIAEYNDRPHSGLPRFEDPQSGRQRHMSPNEAWAAHVANGFEPVAVDPAEADDLFRPYEVRMVRRALVEWNTNSYFHPDLEKWHLKKVAVGYDLHQADRVWVRALDDRGHPAQLICVALFGGNSQRYVPLTFQRKAEEDRAKGRLRRLGVKTEAVLDELRAPLLDAPPAHMTLDLATREIAREPAANAANEGAGPPAPRGAAIGSDADLAQLCLSDPSQLTPGRARVLREAMSRRNGRELLRISGVDLDALDGLLRSAA